MTLKTKQKVLIMIHGAVYASRQKLRGVLRYEQDHNLWQIHLVHSRPGDASFNGNIDRDVQGVIVDMISYRQYGNLIADLNIPCLCFDFFNEQGFLTGKDFCQVNCDNSAIGRLGANHFLERQFEHYGYVNDLLNRCWSIDREMAFVQTLAQSGKFCHVYRSYLQKEDDENNEANDIVSLRKWLLSLPKPIAIMVSMDARAHQVLNICQEEDLRVPDDVAVLGVDNDSLFCQVCSPHLSSIPTCSEEAGYYGAQMFDLLIRHELGENRIYLYGPKPVITRDSTNLVRYNDTLVAETLRLLWNTGNLFVNVGEVAKELGVSRRLLEVRFKEIVGHPVIEEIIRLRLERVCGLLTHTHYPLTEIAEMCGFSCLSYLSRLFKRRIGKTLSEYRKDTEGIFKKGI